MQMVQTAERIGPPEASKRGAGDVPDLWTWLELKIEESGTSKAKLDRTLNLPCRYIDNLCRRKWYPSSREILDRIAICFGAPVEYVDAWWRLAIRRWRATPGGRVALYKAGVCQSETMPCPVCGKLFSGYRFGVRRCPGCRQRRGAGRDRQHAARNRGMAFVDGCLPQLGISRAEFSTAIGAHNSYLVFSAQKEHWYPSTKRVRLMAAVLGIAVEELLRHLDGTHEDWVREIWPLRARLYTLADAADRAAGHGPVYRRWARAAVESGDTEHLEGLKDKLLDLPRKGHARGESPLKGRPKSPDAVRRMAAAQRARWAQLTPEERAQSPLIVAGQSFVKSVAGRGRLSLFAYLRRTPHPTEGELREWAQDVGRRLRSSAAAVLAEWRPILREHSLPLGGRGPSASLDHPTICQTRNSDRERTWREIAVELNHGDPNGLRLAHRNWHRRNSVPACRPLNPP